MINQLWLLYQMSKEVNNSHPVLSKLAKTRKLAISKRQIYVWVTVKFVKINLQSRCFFLGPINSSVVALQTAFANPWPASECLAAISRSFRVWPVEVADAIFAHPLVSWTKILAWFSFGEKFYFVEQKPANMVYVSSSSESLRPSGSNWSNVKCNLDQNEGDFKL